MAIWPFGRKSRRSSKIEEKGTGSAEKKMSHGTQAGTAQTAQGGRGTASSGRPVSRQESKRRKRDKPKRLSKENQARSPEPTMTGPLRPKTEPQPATSGERDWRKAKTGTTAHIDRSSTPLRSNTDHRGSVPSYYFQNPTSNSSLGQDNFTVLQRPPTLRGKRSVQEANLPRRKSSKRKAEDYAREQEVKAMSSPIPIPKRPATHTGGGPLPRDTKKIAGGLNRHFGRPTSDVSLPIPESIESSMSESSDYHAFKVSTFDALTPRPTLRYSENPRYLMPRSANQSRTSTRKDKRPMIPEEVFGSKTRIDELADDLDAGGLRELMERDNRRREKKRQLDQEKLQHKLQRRAERQREDEKRKGLGPDLSTASKPQPEEPNNDAVGLGIGSSGPVAAAEESSMRDMERTKSPSSWLQDPPKENLAPENPFSDDKAEDDREQERKLPPTQDQAQLRIDSAQDMRMSQTSLSPPTSPVHVARDRGSMSQPALARDSGPDIPENVEPNRRGSDQSGRQLNSWTSFFRRGGARQNRSSTDRGRGTPSEFSNTSRESFSRQQPPPPPIPPRSFRRSGNPQRTQSKFREDLPELPISPPDSRIQSPEAPAAVSSSSPHPDRTSSGTAGQFSVAASSSGPTTDRTSQHRSMEPHSPDVAPSSALLSQSLASVDSEGSWLSGKPVKRSSLPASQPLRESANSLQKKLHEFSDSKAEDDVAADEYFSRLTPGADDHPESGPAVRKASSTALQMGGDSDNESDAPPLPQQEEEGRWHGSVGRRPTIVRPEAVRAKPKEGFLNEYQVSESEATSPEGEPSPESETPGFATGSEIHRATSVDYGKGHARHISAGSAKLLDMPRRTSTDSKRLSTGSVERHSTSNPRAERVEEEKA